MDDKQIIKLLQFAFYRFTGQEMEERLLRNLLTDFRRDSLGDVSGEYLGAENNRRGLEINDPTQNSNFNGGEIDG